MKPDTDPPHISVVIPCHNEESGIGHVLSEVPHDRLKRYGYRAELIVVDNNSTDATAAVARAGGARVIAEKKQGKGNAVRTGLRAVHPQSQFVVIIDGDDTYKLTELLRVVEPLEQDFCDIVVGSRLSGRMLDNSLCEHHRIANWAFTFLVRHFYKANITDVLSGYIGMKKQVADEITRYLNTHDFRIEMELITKSVRLGYALTSVPITYDKRRGESKLQSYLDGVKILQTLISNLSWRPPLPAIPART
ncbi:MAG: glycosyltransferase family 2 protein [Patescibacteria group bacterium]|nr:glycosyltransferase family 2 protein [Patescibacteria group bacterium]